VIPRGAPYHLGMAKTEAAPTREKFPPHDFTEDEAHARKGRYVEDPKPVVCPPEFSDSVDDGQFGRIPPAPHGTVYVREAPKGKKAKKETEPEAEAEAEPEPEPEPEPVAEVREIDIEALTVHELKAELDALGVEYTADDRKDDLKALLYDALE
jgi:hypothetical protein